MKRIVAILDPPKEIDPDKDYLWYDDECLGEVLYIYEEDEDETPIIN